MGMSFCPTADFTTAEFDNDLYDFSRKIRLHYQFHNNNESDSSIVKLPSTYTPSPNQDTELERTIHQLKGIRVRKTNVKRNLSPTLQNALRTLSEKVANGDLVIKSADKGDVTVLMSSSYYHTMCMNELSKDQVYRRLGNVNPRNAVLSDVLDFAN